MHPLIPVLPENRGLKQPDRRVEFGVFHTLGNFLYQDRKAAVVNKMLASLRSEPEQPLKLILKPVVELADGPGSMLCAFGDCQSVSAASAIDRFSLIGHHFGIRCPRVCHRPDEGKRLSFGLFMATPLRSVAM